MPVFDQGYVAWQGSSTSRVIRFWPIFRLHTVRLFKKRAVLLLLALSTMTALAYSYQIVMLGTYKELVPAAQQTKMPILIVKFLNGQAVWVLLLSVFVGSGLIARDLQTGSVRLYLSKPITRVDYCLGKFGVIALFLSLPTFVPAVLLLLLHALTNQDFSVLFGPALRAAIGVSLSYMLLCGFFTLAMSALTGSPRMAGVACLGAWFLGQFVAGSLHRVYRGDWTQGFHPARLISSIGERLIAPSTLPGYQKWDNPLLLSTACGIIGIVVLFSLAIIWQRLSKVRR